MVRALFGSSTLLAGIAAAVAFTAAVQYAAPAGAMLRYRDVSALAPLNDVNRSGKTDRLARPVVATPKVMPKMEDQKPVVSKPRKILVGCDPAFSNLSAHAQLNYANRCIS